MNCHAVQKEGWQAVDVVVLDPLPVVWLDLSLSLYLSLSLSLSVSLSRTPLASAKCAMKICERLHKENK